MRREKGVIVSGRGLFAVVVGEASRVRLSLGLHARRAPFVGACRMVGTVLGSWGTPAQRGNARQRGEQPTAGIRVPEITGSAGRG